MTQEDIALSVGTLIVSNWTYFVGGVVTFISASILLSWKIAKSLHQKESDLLRTELSYQNERFSQYEAVVEQRISLLSKEAELLRHKINPSEELILYQSAAPKKESKTKENASKIGISLEPSYARASAKEPEESVVKQVKNILDKTDIISSIIKAATLVVK